MKLKRPFNAIIGEFPICEKCNKLISDKKYTLKRYWLWEAKALCLCESVEMKE